MKKMIKFGTLLLMLATFTISCETDEAKTINSSIALKSSNKINENNIGNYHNDMINFIFADLDKFSNSEIEKKLADSKYSVSKMKEFCILNGITLPSDKEINANFEKNNKTSLNEMISNPIFSSEQKVILSESFNALEIVNDDLNNSRRLATILNSNLEKLQSLQNDNGKIIATATINQLIASNKLWIQEGKINFLKDRNYALSSRPSNGAILGADGKALFCTLLFLEVDSQVLLVGQAQCL